jgi:hypothetical protein
VTFRPHDLLWRLLRCACPDAKEKRLVRQQSSIDSTEAIGFASNLPEPLESYDNDSEKDDLVPSIHRTLIPSLILKKPSFSAADSTGTELMASRPRVSLATRDKECFVNVNIKMAFGQPKWAVGRCAIHSR